jgi:hypothetical protein
MRVMNDIKEATKITGEANKMTGEVSEEKHPSPKKLRPFKF